MPKFSKGHRPNSGNTVFKVAIPAAVFSRGEFYYEGVGVGEIAYFPGENSFPGKNATTGKLHSHFSGGGF